MPEVKWGSREDIVPKVPHKWEHEPFWYVAVSILGLVVTGVVITLIVLAFNGVWMPLAAIGIVLGVISIISSVLYLIDYYDLWF